MILGTYPFPIKSNFGRGLGGYAKEVSSPYNVDWGNASNTSWTIVGTSKQFFMFSNIHFYNALSCRSMSYFGDLNSYIPGDFGASALLGIYNNPSSPYDASSSIFYNSYNGFYTSRNSSKMHTITNQRCKMWIFPSGTSSIFGSSVPDDSTIIEPDMFSNRFFIYRPLFITDEAYPNQIRGEMPGLATPINRIITSTNRPNPNDILTINNERFIFQTVYNNPYNGCVLLSIDKDWNEKII